MICWGRFGNSLLQSTAELHAHTKALFIYALKVGPFLEESGFDFEYL